MWADQEVVRHILGQPSQTESSWGRMLRYIGHWHMLGFGYWAVEDKQTGSFLGEVGLADFKRDIEPALEGKPEAGWVLARSAHGRGLATETVSRVMDWADANLGARITTCIVAPDHGASIRVAEKMGYYPVHTTIYQAKPTLVMERPRGKATSATWSG